MAYMSAAAFASLRQAKAAPVRQAKNNNDVGREPVSFHLAFLLGNDYILPDGHDSVDVLRSPFISKTSKENLTGTKLEFWTKRFITSSLPLDGADGEDKAWQDRLLVITDKRIFIVTEKATGNNGEKQHETLRPTASYYKDEGLKGSSSMEIVNSIPMEEIISVTLDMVSNPCTWSQETVDTFRRSNATLQDLERNLQEIEHSLRQCRPKSTAAHDDTSQPILRILTKPAKFNRGEPYYFLLRTQDYPCIEADGDAAPLHTRADAEALASRVASLAARRRTEHARENRFRRLQKILCHAWNSIPFNILLLFLIVSNFVFTVMQLENKDPDMQPFYENVDLAYTVIFSVGASTSFQSIHIHAGAHAISHV
jgi:hypothetical protein